MVGSSSVRRAGVVLLAAVAVAGYAACGGDGDGDVTEPPPEPTVASVEVTPAADSLDALGSTTQFTATARDADGNALSGADFTWDSSDPGVATVDDRGVATARGNGQAEITATADGVSDSGTLVVSQEVARVSVSPDSTDAFEGETVEFTAEARDANENAVEGVRSFAWSSSDSAVATVDSTGVASAREEGTVEISAEAEGVSGSATLVVLRAVADVSVSPDSAGADALGDTQQFSAEATDEEGATIGGASFEWTSSDDGVATVDDQGLATAEGNGTARIVAAAQGESDTAVYTVDQEVSALTVSPDSTSVEEGDTTRFEAEVEDSNGNAVADADVDWSTTDTTVATVDATGLVTGESEGSAQVVAASGGEADSADVVVETEAAGSIGVVSGDGQNGRTLQDFSDPLVVEVTDGDGDPIDGATVEWSVVDGDASLSSSSTRTGSDGRTQVTATADTLLVEQSVRAVVDRQEVTDSVTFRLETTAAYFEIGDNFFEDWQGRRNENFRADGNISVGDSVVWEYVEGGTVHTVTSGEGEGGDDGSGVPSGGTMFDSGNLEEGDTFVWVPGAAGTWTYFCEIHPTVMFNSVLVVDQDQGGSSDRRAASAKYEPGDVVSPEGSHLKFVYLGPPPEAGGR